jgi:hypothetical protein
MSENLEGEGDVIVASHAHCMEAIPLRDCFEIREFDSICQIKFLITLKLQSHFSAVMFCSASPGRVEESIDQYALAGMS